MALIVQLQAGATEADIQAALVSLPDGATLRLAANQTVQISKGLVMDISARNLTLDLNGSTLKQAGNVAVLTMSGSHEAAQAASLGEANGKTTVTFAGAQGLKAGDWVKVFSDDMIAHDQGDATRMGQAVKVLSVSGNTVTVEGSLLDAGRYQTNIRASAYDSATGRITNGTVAGDQSHDDWRQDLVAVRTAINAQVDHVTVRDNNEVGIKIVDSINASVSQCAAFNLRDDDAAGFWGKAVQSGSSVGTTVSGLFVDKVRHATDSQSGGCAAGDSNPGRYGADIGMKVSDVVANGTTATAFSWHSEGRQSDIHDSVVFNSWGVVGARGVGNSVHDVSAAYNLRGIQVFEYGNGDGRDITISRVQMSNLTYYAYTSVKNPANVVIRDSVFEIAQRITWPTVGITALNNLLTYASGLNKVLTGTDGVDRLLGTVGTDSLNAGGGNDYLWGGAGVDTLTGGSGSDRFAYHSVSEGGDVITDFDTSAKGDIIDVSVLALMNGWIGDPVATGAVRVRQVGADSVVEAKTGAKNGDAYAILATLLNTKASEVESHVSRTIAVTGSAAEADIGAIGSKTVTSQLVLTALMGTSNADALTGADGANWLVEAGWGDDRITLGNGNDVVTGGRGNDVIATGAGNDTIRFSSTAEGSDAIDGGAGNDRIVAMKDGTKIGLTSVTGIETITADGHTGVTIVGSGLNDTIDLRGVAVSGIGSIQLGTGNDTFFGSSGNDLVNGSWGDDNLSGMAGDDTFVAGKWQGNDTIAGGEGFDTIQVANAGTSLNWAQISSIEAFVFDAGANLTLVGSAGNDVMDMSAMRVNGGVTLNGGRGDDMLVGTQADDILIGNSGADQLTGGAGRDTFRFAFSGDSRPGNGIDRITDFTRGVDLIDLSAIDANSTMAGQQRFTFIGDAAYSKVAGQLHLETTAGLLTLAGDINGDGKTDFAITFAAGTQLTLADLVL